MRNFINDIRTFGIRCNRQLRQQVVVIASALAMRYEELSTLISSYGPIIGRGRFTSIIGKRRTPAKALAMHHRMHRQRWHQLQQNADGLRQVMFTKHRRDV